MFKKLLLVAFFAPTIALCSQEQQEIIPGASYFSRIYKNIEGELVEYRYFSRYVQPKLAVMPESVLHPSKDTCPFVPENVVHPPKDICEAFGKCTGNLYLFYDRTGSLLDTRCFPSLLSGAQAKRLLDPAAKPIAVRAQVCFGFVGKSVVRLYDAKDQLLYIGHHFKKFSWQKQWYEDARITENVELQMTKQQKDKINSELIRASMHTLKKWFILTTLPLVFLKDSINK